MTEHLPVPQASPADEVLRAADELVRAFGSHNRERYFAAFHPQATFIFHSTSTVLRSRAEYEKLWRSWEQADGFAVLDCRSTNQQVRMAGEVGIFTHDVLTRIRTHGGEEDLSERETIVFQRCTDGWLAVHEHLSPAPQTEG